MEYKFSITSDDKIVGYCNDIIGLEVDKVKIYNDKNDDEEKYNEIELIDFKLCDEYLKYLKESKYSFQGKFNINVLDYDGISIGSYRFSLVKNIKYKQLNEMKECKSITLVVWLCEVAIGNELKMWDKWRISRPKQKNEWVELSNQDRIAWLNIAELYHSSKRRFNNEPYENMTGGTYYLDCSNITTFESFFCAIGETIYGPGGYYGADGNTLAGHLEDSSGIHRPFKLILKNSSVAMKSLSKNEWRRYIKRKKDQYAKVFYNYEYNKTRHSFFNEIIEIFIWCGVTVELEP